MIPTLFVIPLDETTWVCDKSLQTVKQQGASSERKRPPKEKKRKVQRIFLVEGIACANSHPRHKIGT